LLSCKHHRRDIRCVLLLQIYDNFRAVERTAFAQNGRIERHTMDVLSLFGLFAVTSMLVCYALEDRSHWFILAFAAACALGSIYGFLQGAWPFGLSRQSGPVLHCGAGASGSV
jgi:hypothetical protein